MRARIHENNVCLMRSARHFDAHLQPLVIRCEGSCGVVYDTLREQNARRERSKQNAITDEGDQVAAISNYDGFIRRRIFPPRGSAGVCVVRDVLRGSAFPGWRIDGQVSSGGITKGDVADAGNDRAEKAHRSINSKRADSQAIRGAARTRHSFSRTDEPQLHGIVEVAYRMAAMRERYDEM
jgi:hypothetical protein